MQIYTILRGLVSDEEVTILELCVTISKTATAWGSVGEAYAENCSGDHGVGATQGHVMGS